MSKVKENLRGYIEDLIQRYPVLEESKECIEESYLLLEECFASGGKILVAGNGGSAADSNHIVGELMKGFCAPRKIGSELAQALEQVDREKGRELAEKLQGALPAIALDNHNALNTAFLNDVDGQLCYAQQVMGYGINGDIFVGISTSGNSKNVQYAAITAKAKGMKVIALTGAGGGRLAELSDVCVKVCEQETYRIQELHLPVYHCLCLMLEKKFFGE